MSFGSIRQGENPLGLAGAFWRAKFTMPEHVEFVERTKDEDVIRLEAAIGCALPHPNPAFLLEKNGGRPAANELVFGEHVEDNLDS